MNDENELIITNDIPSDDPQQSAAPTAAPLSGTGASPADAGTAETDVKPSSTSGKIAPPGAGRGTSRREGAAQAPAEGNSDAPGDKEDDGEVREPQKSFAEAAREHAREEDDLLTKQHITLSQILGGDFFMAQILRRQIWLIILITAFAMVYIASRYSCQKSQLEIDKLNTQLKDAKYKALSSSSQLTEKSRESNVLNMLKNCKDSTLHIADQPPYTINVPEE